MFVHLHVHTEYSLLDGLSRIEPLVERARELGMDSLGITDHGTMYGAIDLYRAAAKAGIKPIIGCEMYVAPESRLSRNAQDKSPHHLTVLAKNGAGYQNLLKLATLAHTEGFYHKPRVDRELLERYGEGLVVLSGCPSGEVPRLLAQGRMDEARDAARWYAGVLDDYYLELMDHAGVPGLPEINRGLLRLHDEVGLPLAATNDTHYTHREDAPLQDILVCIQTNTNVQDKGRLRMEDDSYYLKSAQEMSDLFSGAPEAVSNTQAIADKCDLTLDFSRLRLPQYGIPDGTSADAFLTRLCWEGLRRRSEHPSAVEEERLRYELEVVAQTRYANYFLVVWDIARFTRENDILFAVRGSAAASLALYCLGVTDVNPLPHRLVFERFLNVERKELPDIDMDFQDDRREEVINYVVGKYGRDHVAQIITFGTLGARAAIRDVGRALAMPYADVDRVARLVPFRLHITLDEAMDLNPELKEVYDADAAIKTLVDTARSLEGVTRHASTHAAGVVISEEALDAVVPLQRPVRGDDHGVLMTQYSMGPIAALGLLKMDFLGLVNLTVLDRVRHLVAGEDGGELDLRSIPLDDPTTFEMLSRGETVGVFQLEGAGMTRHIKELKPTSLADLAAMIALYRPGPMEHIGTFIAAKHGRAAPTYPHEALSAILEETYGVIVYQDQVLQIARTFAGYTLGEADVVRKAMGKKVPEIMARERERFIDGARQQGYSEELAAQVFAIVEPFAGYAFNKAHSVSYGLISYWTAYLKANHSAEYMVSLLNAYAGAYDKIAAAVTEARRLKIPVLRPDVNHSGVQFTIEAQEDGRKAIRFGLASVKNVGESAVAPIIQARKREGQFTSIEHMCRVGNLASGNRKALESLIKAGAFESFGRRAAHLDALDRILALAQREAHLRESGQTSLFDMFGQEVPAPLATLSLADIETSPAETAGWEQELLGIPLTGNRRLDAILASGVEAVVSKSELSPELAGKRVLMVGQVSSAVHRLTRAQRPYTLATIELLDGPVEVFVWDNVRQHTTDLWQQGTLVKVVGEVRLRDDRVSISCTDAEEFKAPHDDAEGDDEPLGPSPSPRVSSEGLALAPTPPPSSPPRLHGASNGAARRPKPVQDNAPAGGGRRLTLLLRESDHPDDDQHLLAEIRRLLLDYRGADEVRVDIATQGSIVTMEWPQVRVDASGHLLHQLQELLGHAGQALVEGPAA